MSLQENSTAVRRRQSIGEEIANSVSHGMALVLALLGTPFLIVEAATRGGTADVVGAAVFAATVVLAYTASTLYHAFPHGAAKRVLRALDHGTIFLLIAGTYTPFTLGVLRGGWGWSLFGAIWTLALAGVILKASGGVRFHRLSIVLYLVMGWMVIVAIKPLAEAMEPAGLAWLVAGGLAYTAGVVFYALDRIPYCHFIWHLFVITGTACHFFAVLGYAS
ncbi:MAG: hemolysin III family protein [Gammaproteobacteria bacterium]